MYFGISNEDKIKMFDEGKIDFAAVTGENAKKYDGKDSSTADSDSVIWDLVPNFKDRYLSDTRVREAMSLLLERKNTINRYCMMEVIRHRDYFLWESVSTLISSLFEMLLDIN